MRIKNLIFGAMALLAVATGCRKAEIFERSVVSVSAPADVTFPLNEEKQTFELKVDANCSWVVKEDANWLVVRPMSGNGKGTVTVYVAPNEGTKREAVINFYKDDSRKVCAPITISQTGTQVGPEKGDGTFEHPYLASQASEVAAALASGATTETEVYVQGYVKKFGSKHEDGMASYGNATFYLSDDETYAGTDFQCYQVYYAKGVKFTSLDQIKVGDLVVVCSKLTNYNGTPETVGKGEGYCVSINGTSTGDNPGPGPTPGPDPGEIGPYTNTLAVTVSASDVSYDDIKVKINDDANEYPAIKLGKSGSGGKATVTVPAGTSKVSFYAVAWNGKTSKLSLQTANQAIVGTEISPAANSGAAGSEKVLALVNISKNNHYVIDLGTTLASDTQYILSTADERAILFGIQAGEGTEGGEGDDPTPGPGPDPVPGTGDGSLEKPYSASQALAIAQAMADGAEQEAYVTGYVSAIKSIDTGSYGNAEYSISDDGTSTNAFSIYRGYYLNGDKFTSADQLKVGDKVVILGKIVNYKGNTPQMTTGSKIISINAEGGEGGDPEPGPDPIGGIANTMETAYTTSEAIALYDAGNDLTTAVYVKGKFVKTTTSDANIANYKNMDIYVTDGTNEFEFFRCKNLNDTDFTSNPFKEGDELIAYGVLDKYNSTYELKQGCYIVKHTPGEGGDPDPEPEPDPTPDPDPSLGQFDSNITWSLGTNSYTETATVNSTSDVKILKLGTSKAAGTATLSVPAGTSAISLYCVGWKGSSAKASFTMGGSQIKEISPAANDGASSTAPYTMTVIDSDHYVIDLGGALTAAADITVTSTGRVIIFGVQTGEGVEGEPEKEFTLDDIDVLEADYYAEGPIWDFTLYASEGVNYGLYLGGASAKAKDKIAGSYTLAVDEEWYGLMSEDGTFDPMTSGTISISCVSAETEESYGVYSATVDLTLASGTKINRTFSSLITYALDADTYNAEDGSCDDIVLVDTPSPAVNSKAVKAVKKTVKKHTVKKSLKSLRR